MGSPTQNLSNRAALRPRLLECDASTPSRRVDSRCTLECRMPRRAFLAKLMPPGSYQGQSTLTQIGRRFLRNSLAAFVSLAIGGVGLALIAKGDWAPTISGILIGFSVPLLIWSIRSYVLEDADVASELERRVAVDLLHARLNQLAVASGAPVVDLDNLISIQLARQARLAHLSGLEEHSPTSGAFEDGYAFWDDVAQGRGENSR